MKLYIQMYILSVRHLGFSNIFSDNNYRYRERLVTVRVYLVNRGLIYA
jgi:hypothetical protein